MSSALPPKNLLDAATLSSPRQGRAALSRSVVGRDLTDGIHYINRASGARGGDTVRFSGKIPVPQVINYKYWWAEFQQWFPEQKMLIASALEAGFNRLRTWFAGGMMALATVFPMPDWLLQKISRDYFYSPRKVLNPLSFQANELNTKILSNSFQVKPGTSDLSTIHSFYLKAKEGQPTIVFSHGRDTNVGHLEGLFKGAQEKGYGFFAYDYPGFGRSEGHPDEKSLEEAGIAACRFLAGEEKKHNYGYGGGGYNVDYKDQIIMGYSLGGAVAVKVARRFATEPSLFTADKGQPRGLILVNTFTDIKELFKVKSSALHQKVAQWFDPGRTGLGFDSDKKIADVNMPVLSFHSEKDKIVPWKQGKALNDAATVKFKKFVPKKNENWKGHSFKRPEQCVEVLNDAEAFFKTAQKQG